ncbi:unnamed protein product [Phytophthora lilii]|uniref:Unnamed protein product n=1 Tax=Phytophthora lilii TaxID=2077276 RepID=A0A9W6WZS5_9STRA|nr:unnamed protein product [Phytophthora lilii]
MEITKTYSVIKANSHKAFAPFMEAVSNARREGDVDKSKAMIAEMMKLSSDKAIKNKIEHFTFHGLEALNDAWEITMKKRRLNFKNLIHLSIAIYQLAKLRMLQVYYDCIDFYFDRTDFQYQEMDTDSAYIAFSCDIPFQDCIKPELRNHYKEHKYDWFPRDYNTEVAKFDRTPGLFKDEWSGDAMVSLSSKNYICYLPDETYKVKVSAKGVQQGRGRNEDVLNPNGSETVVRDRTTLQDRHSTLSRAEDDLMDSKSLHIILIPGKWILLSRKKRPILTAININSRLGYAKLLPNKTVAAVLSRIKTFVRLNTVNILRSDNGSEFMNAQAQAFFKSKKIDHCNNEPGDHGTMGKIERFNRTFKQRLTRISPKKITHKLVSDIFENYNSTFHQSIGMTPNEAKDKVMESELKHNQKKPDLIENEMEIGSNVLYRLKKQTFDKEATRWSKAVYKIVDHKSMRSGKFKYLVQWVSNEPDSWEPQDNLRLVNKNRKSTLENEYWARKNK